MKQVLFAVNIATMLAMSLLSAMVVAEEKTIYLGGYGGLFERLLKEKNYPTG